MAGLDTLFQAVFAVGEAMQKHRHARIGPASQPGVEPEIGRLWRALRVIGRDQHGKARRSGLSIEALGKPVDRAFEAGRYTMDRGEQQFGQIVIQPETTIVIVYTATLRRVGNRHANGTMRSF